MTMLLLDTCAAIWLVEGEKLRGEADKAIFEAAMIDSLFVSPVSAWEVALLCSGNRFLYAKTQQAANLWVARLFARTGVQVAPLTPQIAAGSAFLPDFTHRDPADRFLIATARSMNIPLVTRDRVMLRYAEAGHVRCIPC